MHAHNVNCTSGSHFHSSLTTQYRPPSPHLSKVQNSKASVPSANGGSVQRSSASQSSSVKNLGPTALAQIVGDRPCHRRLTQTLSCLPRVLGPSRRKAKLTTNLRSSTLIRSVLISED